MSFSFGLLWLQSTNEKWPKWESFFFCWCFFYHTTWLAGWLVWATFFYFCPCLYMSLSASTSLMITSAGLHFHLHSLRPLLTPHETNKKMKRKRKNGRKQTTTLNRFECRMREWKKNGIQTEYHQLVSKNHQAREFRCTFLNKRLSKQFVKDHQFSTQIPKQTKRPKRRKKNKQTKKSNEKNGKSGEVKEIQIKQENMETFQSNADQAHYCGIRTVKKWNLLNILSEIS